MAYTLVVALRLVLYARFCFGYLLATTRDNAVPSAGFFVGIADYSPTVVVITGVLSLANIIPVFARNVTGTGVV